MNFSILNIFYSVDYLKALEKVKKTLPGVLEETDKCRGVTWKDKII